MAGVDPISQTGPATAAAPNAAAPSDGAAAKVQDAFARGIVMFMGSMLQSMESDVQQACQDNTSDPDAPA